MSKFRLVSGHSGKAGDKLRLKVEGDLKQRIIFRDCHHVIIEDARVLDWSDKGDVLKGKEYAITFDNCSDADVIKPVVKGAPVDNQKLVWGAWADAWADTVGNGVVVLPNCKRVKIGEPEISRCHVGLLNRGAVVSVLGGVIREISGDHVQNLGADFEMIGTKKLWVIPCLIYKKWHTDALQVFDTDFDAGRVEGSAPLENITVRDCVVKVWANKKVHPYCANGQALLFSDGHGKGFDISNNEIHCSHEIAILMNPCSHSKIEDNKIYVVGDARPVCGFEDRKKYGVEMVNVITANNQIIYLEDAEGEAWLNEQKEDNPKIDISKGDFDSVVGSLKNKQAEAVKGEDYQAAAVRLGVSVNMIKAVAKVESRGNGFNADGSVKLLYERHIFRRECKKAGVDIGQVEKHLDSNLISRRVGGYRGGIAEYWRAKQAASVGVNSGHDFLMMSLSSCSMGGFQTMGFNHALCGFDSPLHMIQEYHSSEVSQLNGFCSFLENTGLIVHLREAEKLIKAGKSPRKEMGKFATGYNGKAHKNYDLKIMAEYNRLDDKPVEFKKIRNSDTLQGGAITGVGGVGIAYGISEAYSIIEGLMEARDKAAVVVETLNGDMAVVREQLKDSAGDYDRLMMIVYVLVACLVVSNLGTIKSMMARLRDRALGIH